jgi:hypothetical protein
VKQADGYGGKIWCKSSGSRKKVHSQPHCTELTKRWLLYLLHIARCSNRDDDDGEGGCGRHRLRIQWQKSPGHSSQPVTRDMN